MKDDINSHDVQDMLDDKVTYWIAGGCYDYTEADRTNKHINDTLIGLGLDLKDFNSRVFMDHIIVSKRI